MSSTKYRDLKVILVDKEKLAKIQDNIDLIVGMTGPIYSGCTTISNYLTKKMNFLRVSISEEFIRKPLRDANDGVDPSREECQDYGDALRRIAPDHFVGCFIEKYFDRLIAEKIRLVVIDALRNHMEVMEFRKYFNDKFYLMAVQASYNVRVQRRNLKFGNNDPDRKIFDKENKRDAKDIDLFGQQVERCIELADVFLANDYNIDYNEVYNRVDDSDNKEGVETPITFTDVFYNTTEKRLDHEIIFLINTIKGRRGDPSDDEKKMMNDLYFLFRLRKKINRIIDVMRSGKLTQPQISLTRIGATGEDLHPTLVEVMMSMAFTMSLFSNCKKKQVGAIITKKPVIMRKIASETIEKGTNPKSEKNANIKKKRNKTEYREYVISGGWNQVLLDNDFCTENEFCYRDLVKYKALGDSFDKCPKCGNAMTIEAQDRFTGEKKTIDREILKNLETRINDFKDIISPTTSPSLYTTDEAKKFLVYCQTCIDSIPPQDFIKILFPIKDLYHCKAVHGEENAILNSSRFGSASLIDATLYTTYFPCFQCTKKIIASGIRKVVFFEPYSDAQSELGLKNAGIQIEQFSGFTPMRLFRLFKSYFL